MRLEILKLEALKLGKSELADFAQFIRETMRQREDNSGNSKTIEVRGISQ